MIDFIIQNINESRDRFLGPLGVIPAHYRRALESAFMAGTIAGLSAVMSGNIKQTRQLIETFNPETASWPCQASSSTPHGNTSPSQASSPQPAVPDDSSTPAAVISEEKNTTP